MFQDTNEGILFCMFEDWLLTAIFMSLWFDIINVPIFQRQGKTNLPELVGKG